MDLSAEAVLDALTRVRLDGHPATALRVAVELGGGADDPSEGSVSRALEGLADGGLLVRITVSTMWTEQGRDLTRTCQAYLPSGGEP